jgi:hypothetical protein
MEGTEARALGGDRRQCLQEVAGRAGQPVEARHWQHVALSKLAEDATQLGAVGPRAADLLAVDFGTTFGAELLELSVEARRC